MQNLLPCCLMWWSLMVLGSEGIHYHILNHKCKCKQLSTKKPGCPLAGWNLIKSWTWKERSETNYKHSGNLADLSLYFLICQALQLLWLNKPQSSIWKFWALNYKNKPGHQNINVSTSMRWAEQPVSVQYSWTLNWSCRPSTLPSGSCRLQCAALNAGQECKNARSKAPYSCYTSTQTEVWLQKDLLRWSIEVQCLLWSSKHVLKILLRSLSNHLLQVQEWCATEKVRAAMELQSPTAVWPQHTGDQKVGLLKLLGTFVHVWRMRRGCADSPTMRVTLCLQMFSWRCWRI